jgi:hypothetical protein
MKLTIQLAIFLSGEQVWHALHAYLILQSYTIRFTGKMHVGNSVKTIRVLIFGPAFLLICNFIQTL